MNCPYNSQFFALIPNAVLTVVKDYSNLKQDLRTDYVFPSLRRFGCNLKVLFSRSGVRKSYENRLCILIASETLRLMKGGTTLTF